MSVITIDSETVLWRRIMAGGSVLAYPADVAPLAAGQTYVWQVESVADSRQGVFAEFSVATKGERADMQHRLQELARQCNKLRLKQLECILTTAGLYLQAGFGNDAVQLMVAAQRQGKTDPTLALLLGRLLAMQ